MVNIAAANLQTLSKFYRRPNDTSQTWLKVVIAN